MSALKDLQSILAGPRESWGAGVVASGDGVSLTVAMDGGAERKVFGSASVGQSVLVRGDQVLAVLDTGEEVVVYV